LREAEFDPASIVRDDNLAASAFRSARSASHQFRADRRNDRGFNREDRTESLRVETSCFRAGTRELVTL
jgi:hypothetical protein